MSCPIGFLSGDSEWRRCTERAFYSDFDQLTELFSLTMAFFEPGSSERIWEKLRFYNIRFSTKASWNVPER